MQFWSLCLRFFYINQARVLRRSVSVDQHVLYKHFGRALIPVSIMYLPLLCLVYTMWIPLLSLIVLYHVLTALYNITLHPLAKVPGSKLAGMTRLYQTYWCYGNGRSLYYRKVQQMHERYGPIVRVNPNEVSLRDPKDFEKVYTIRSRYPKDPLFYRTMGVLKGMFGRTDNETHRKLRQPWAGYFSKNSIAVLEGLIHKKVDLLCRNAMDELEKTGRIPIQGLLHALMIDVVSAYTMPNCMDMLAQRPYATEYASNLLNQAGFIWVMMISDWIYHVVQAILALYSRVFNSTSEFDKLLQVRCRLHIRYSCASLPILETDSIREDRNVHILSTNA